MLTKEGVDFGILTPPRPIFKFAVAVFDKNTFSVLQNLHIRSRPGQGAEDQLAKIAEGQVNQARALYRERFAPKVVPELLAYARSLPEDSRPYAFEGEDEDLLEQATSDLTKGLVHALRFKDEYRAAVAMEKAVAYFVPDRKLLPILRDLIDECDQSFVAKPLMLEVAKATQRSLLASSITIRSVLADVCQDEPETAGYSVR
jgi:hypothetical protein